MPDLTRTGPVQAVHVVVPTPVDHELLAGDRVDIQRRVAGGLGRLDGAGEVVMPGLRSEPIQYRLCMSLSLPR